VKRLAIILPTTAAAATGLVLMAASGSAQTPGATTLQLFERERGSSFGFVDNRPRARNERASVGDMFAFNSPIFDQARTTRLGVISVQCTVTRPGREAQSESMCSGALRLRDGLITIATTIKGSPRTVTAAVTGGTGAYNGARGTFTSTTVRGGSEDTIALIP
jgi:hypothetical protein